VRALKARQSWSSKILLIEEINATSLMEGNFGCGEAGVAFGAGSARGTLGVGADSVGRTFGVVTGSARGTFGVDAGSVDRTSGVGADFVGEGGGPKFEYGIGVCGIGGS
jgi:hypothetical protein